MALYSHMENKFSRMAPLPQELQVALVGKQPPPSGPTTATAASSSEPPPPLPLYGSPLLDYELNFRWSLANVIEELERALDINHALKVGLGPGTGDRLPY